LSAKVFDIVSNFVQTQLGDLQVAAMKLALGRFEGSPFAEGSPDKGERSESFGSNWRDSFATGVPLGFKEPFPKNQMLLLSI